MCRRNWEVGGGVQEREQEHEREGVRERTGVLPQRFVSRQPAGRSRAGRHDLEGMEGQITIHQ